MSVQPASSTPALGPQPTLSTPTKAGHSVLSLDYSPPTGEQTLRIRGDLHNDLANMSRRAARAASTSIPTSAASRLVLLPEHGPSLRVLTQRHQDGFIKAGMERIQKEILTEPTASKVVLDVDRIETEHPDKCFLYYAMSSRNYISILFTSALFSAALDKGDRIADRPPFIRLPEPIGPKTVQEFLHNNPPGDDPLYDHEPHVRKELVSVNLTPFSNPNEPGECTWVYYLQNANIVNRKPLEFFQMVFDRYGLAPDPAKREAYIEELAALHHSLQQCAYDYLSAMRSRDTENIDLLQFESDESQIKKGSRAIIFQYEASENIVHEICYPSKAFGIPNNKFSSFPATLRAQCDEVFPDGSSDTEKAQIENDRLSLQGRLLAQSTMVPEHNIQTYTHGYGRFFGIPGSDDELVPSETGAPSGRPREWSIHDCRRLASQANAAENSFECLELIVRKEMLLERAKRVFAAAIAESGASTSEN